MHKSHKSFVGAVFSLGPLRGYCAPGTQHTGQLSWCHLYKRFNFEIFDKGYIHRFLTLVHTIFKVQFLVENMQETPNFCMDLIGGTMPEVPNIVGILDQHPLNIGTTCTCTHAFAQFFTISLCKCLKHAKKPQILCRCRFFTLTPWGPLCPRYPTHWAAWLVPFVQTVQV